jgi:hypothetical protein
VTREERVDERQCHRRDGVAAAPQPCIKVLDGLHILLDRRARVSSLDKVNQEFIERRGT